MLKTMLFLRLFALWLERSDQRYKCKDCGRLFDGSIRWDKFQVITDYVESKQTLGQFALEYGVNEKTIRRDLEDMCHVQKLSKYKQASIKMDTTYGGGVGSN